jgi:hypothetical protein
MTHRGNDTFAEQYRLAAEKWVAEDSAARLLEETKSLCFSQMVAKQGEIPVSRAEHNVRSSNEWRTWVVNMVEQRSNANAAKVEMRYMEMKFFEQQSESATARSERRM